MPRNGFSASALTAGASLVVLVFAGLVLLMLFAVYAAIAAVVALIPVLYVDAKRDSAVTQESPAFVIPLALAFLVSGAAAFVLDLIFKTYVSVPAMIDALDLTRFEYARRVPLIESVLDYYVFVLGPTPGTWLRYVGFQIAIVLVFAGVLYRLTADEALEPESPIKRKLQILLLSAVAVGTSAVTLFPLTTWAMIALRNLNN
jgi:hypothetical protein